MKLAIIGSRGFKNYKILCEEVNNLNLSSIESIISGGAKGADTLASIYAKEQNIQLIEILPDWLKYGKSAGIIRNKEIIEKCDMVIAFWDGLSKGTESSIKLAKKNKKPTKVITIPL